MNNNRKEEDLLVRKQIMGNLKEIGYPKDRSSWKDTEVKFSSDGEKLEIYGHPVMERWEEPYMKELARIATLKAKENQGRVLELGFGMGISAGFVQQHNPKEHVIIEANKSIANLAREFSANSTNKITIIEGFWEDVVPSLETGTFDGILFDTYPLNEEEVDVIFFPFLEHAYRLLKKEGVLTYYSDEPDWFMEDHIQELKKAGFNELDGVICHVNPPTDCKYWKQNTILAPIIIKK